MKWLLISVGVDILLQINVNGANTEPLWTFLKSQQHGFLIDAIKWNFTKFLVDKEGSL